MRYDDKYFKGTIKKERESIKSAKNYMQKLKSGHFVMSSISKVR